ncbi:hypothetical protein RGU70_13750 [Herbaspirillum sp. RTI4]|uniref:hypothetical protein n=1 Tax=Herbaspirillum sp. RTI4 TaxID=3048640 RepID=UPI002AB32A10|nr:hypothetical protein [Herbaspirillum sp. RTI4]MDY7579378.1 hypothetical protein [Herbaspirillum sp. RTI4]MEA9980292.1 hypothetical protein [Herbaspirillum sp. RTI4]
MTTSTERTAHVLPPEVIRRLSEAAKSHPNDPNRRNQAIDDAIRFARNHYPKLFNKE